MDRTPVVSSNVESVGYDPMSQILEVEFRGGSVYQYDGVPQAIYEAVLNASSVGGTLNQMVKGVYSYRRIS